MRIHPLLLIVGIATASFSEAAQLAVRVEGNQIRAAAPHLRLLVGAPLDRLHNGASVHFVLQLGLFMEPDSRPTARAIHRFAVSYDLWEEKFAVTRLEPVRRSASHLSASAIEAWLVESLWVPAEGLAPDRRFWIRLDFRTEDPRNSVDLSDNSSLSLGALIDIFSRKNPGDQLRGSEEAGPFRLMDLRPKENGRGKRH